MSAILYTLIDGKVIEELVNPIDVANLLTKGYKSSPEQFADTNKSGKLSAKEVREAAKLACIEDYKTAKIDELKVKLGYEKN